MLKDNHVTISGSIQNAIVKVKSVAGFATKIEVECRNIDEALNAAESSVDIIMLDNFTPAVSSSKKLGAISALFLELFRNHKFFRILKPHRNS